MTKVAVEYKHTTGDSFYCEYCGWCWEETTTVTVDGKVVYEYWTDNHLGASEEMAHEGAESPKECVFLAVKDALRNNTEEEYSEEKRKEWNRWCPGNGVANTPENWEKYKQRELEAVEDDCAEVWGAVEGAWFVLFAESLSIMALFFEHFGYEVEFKREEEYD